jgi:hypothetical protein
MPLRVGAGDPGGELGAGGEGELGQGVADVRFDGAFADEELRRDLAVRQSTRDELRDFPLAASQRRCRRRGSSW